MSQDGERMAKPNTRMMKRIGMECKGRTHWCQIKMGISPLRIEQEHTHKQELLGASIFSTKLHDWDGLSKSDYTVVTVMSLFFREVASELSDLLLANQYIVFATELLKKRIWWQKWQDGNHATSKVIISLSNYFILVHFNKNETRENYSNMIKLLSRCQHTSNVCYFSACCIKKPKYLKFPL